MTVAELEICHLNGELLSLEQARISPLDRGFLFADGVYEVIPVYAGKPFRLDDHLRRLQGSLAAIQLTNPHSPDEWRGLIEQLCQANGGGDLSIYLQITRGSPTQRRHELPPATCPPTVFAMASRLPPITNRELGLSAVTREDTRWTRCDIKSIALLPNVLLRHEAVAQGADEAILQRAGVVTEGAASTVFLVRNGCLSTPELHTGLLHGVTREVTLELAARHGVPCSCREITVDELDKADEIWLTSSTKEVAPVVELNQRPVGDGNIGPMFRSMRGWLDNLKQEA